MNIIYFDYIENYGINAGVGADWDFYHSFDELVKECVRLYSDNFILASVVVNSSHFVGYSESLNHE
ncbi:hypothetical protein I5F00_17400 [Proteus mirabilis]|uniref:hypothetical protein n=1 Tax=Proteus mirabilis TaxID=584 RepID=UPI0018C75C7D|nr:hypothetical protein [Proteus mirabilis]